MTSYPNVYTWCHHFMICQSLLVTYNISVIYWGYMYLELKIGICHTISMTLESFHIITFNYIYMLGHTVSQWLFILNFIQKYCMLNVYFLISKGGLTFLSIDTCIYNIAVTFMSVQSNTLFNKKLILYIFSLYIHKNL